MNHFEHDITRGYQWQIQGASDSGSHFPLLGLAPLQPHVPKILNPPLATLMFVDFVKIMWEK